MIYAVQKIRLMASKFAAYEILRYTEKFDRLVEGNDDYIGAIERGWTVLE